MPQRSKPKKLKKIKDPTPDTAFAKKSCGMPLTKKYIDVEAGIKKDKEVKEKDVFDFKPKTASKK
tara:strand:- start:1574 stop:1768 length:195 start_codon:yes stop_codon:yes gene_type:complete